MCISIVICHKDLHVSANDDSNIVKGWSRRALFCLISALSMRCGSTNSNSCILDLSCTFCEINSSHVCLVCSQHPHCCQQKSHANMREWQEVLYYKTTKQLYWIWLPNRCSFFHGHPLSTFTFKFIRIDSFAQLIFFLCCRTLYETNNNDQLRKHVYSILKQSSGRELCSCEVRKCDCLECHLPKANTVNWIHLYFTLWRLCCL